MPTLRTILRAIAFLVRGQPSVPRDAARLLDDVQPPTPEELERYVPQAYRNPGPGWIFTRGKVLTFTEHSKTRRVGSVAGFDVAREFDEDYSVYLGVYGYRDQYGRLHTFRMPATEDGRAVRPGRAFLICFDRRAPRVHRLFTFLPLAHPARGGTAR